MRRHVTWRKRRTGCWVSTGRYLSTGQGSGKVIPDGTGDEFDDADESDDSDDDGGDQVAKLKQEAKKRRLQAKEWRRRAEAAEAKLAENGQSSRPDNSDLVLTLVENGMSRDRVRAALKLVDWDSVEDVDDAIDQLKEDHPFLFESGQQQQQEQDLPRQGSRGNRDKNRGGGPSQTELYRKYPALRR